jgi:hypothetical protein
MSSRLAVSFDDEEDNHEGNAFVEDTEDFDFYEDEGSDDDDVEDIIDDIRYLAMTQTQAATWKDIDDAHMSI